MKHLHLTPSRIKRFDECELTFKYDMEHEGDTPSNPVLRIGSTTHLCIEQYIVHCVETNQQTDIEEMLKIVIRNRRGLKSDAEKQEVRVLCQRYAENNIVPDNANSETQFAFNRQWKPCPWDSEGVYFRCRPDLWYVPEPGVVSITDFTTSRVVPRDIYETGKFEQVQMYGFALIKSGLIKEINELRLTVLNVRYNIPNTFVVYPGEFLYVKDVVGETYSKMLVAYRTGKWKHSIGDKCHYCNHFRYCEAITESLKKMYDEPVEDAPGLVDAMGAHEATAARIEAILKNHVEANGNIVMPDGSQFGEYLKKGKKYIARRVASAITKHSDPEVKAQNLDAAMKEFSVSATSVKKLIKTLDLRSGAKDAMMAASVEANQNRFGAIPKNEDPFGDI